MSSYIFYAHSYHLELNQLLSFKFCLVLCVCLSLWMWMDEFLSVCTEWLIRKRPLPPPSSSILPLIFPRHRTPRLLFHLPLVHMLSLFTILHLLPLISLLSYLFSLFNPPFIPFKMNVHTLRHLPGAVVARQHCFLLPKQKKKESMIYSMRREI